MRHASAPWFRRAARRECMNVTATMIQKLLSYSSVSMFEASSQITKDLSLQQVRRGCGGRSYAQPLLRCSEREGGADAERGGATRRAVSSQTPSFPPLPSPSPAESVWESRGWWCVCHALFLSQAMFLPPPSGEVGVSARRRLGWEARARTSCCSCSASRTSVLRTTPPHIAV